jgi:hypothetical protein
MKILWRFLALALPVVSVALGLWFWLGQPVSDQELLANFAKAGDFLRGFQNIGSWPWWSPMFQQGTSLAPAWGMMFSNALLLAGAGGFGFLLGSKVAVAACLIAGAAGMFFFLRRWVDNRLAAWLGAILFLMNPSVLTRAAAFEHFVVVASLAIFPWVLWALVGFLREGTSRSAIALAVAFSALALVYGKTALMAALALVAFAAAEYFAQPRSERPNWKAVALALGAVVFLAVIPNLPALRETSFVTMFQLGPFEGWQRAFSSKSALSWFDRGGVLGSGMDAGFAPTTLNGGTYLGFVAGAVLAGALLRGSLHGSPVGRAARWMLTLALGMFWISFGPLSVLGGHFEFLKMSPGAADFTPAMAWFLLAAQVWVVFQIVPRGSQKWHWIAAALSVVYLIVPGFRLLEWLPLYSNIRAPFDYFQVTGAVFVVAAVALAAATIMKTNAVMAVILVLLAALDAGVYAKPFFVPKMDRAVWTDFLAAQEFLKSSPTPGRVYPFSGRYFYLMTPWLSGRPLAAEAFNNYLQQRHAAVLQASAFMSDDQLESYFRVAGVAFLLIDKTDPDTTSSQQERLRKMGPVVFESPNIALLEVKKPLGYAFLARDFIQTSSDAPETAVAALGGAAHHLAVIQTAGGETAEPGLRGRVVDGRIAQRDGEVLEEGRDFLPIAKTGITSYQRSEFVPTGEPGWLVFNEACHPDWTASEGGKSLAVTKGLLAFSAVKTEGKSPVVFEFRPPWWYDWCAWTGVCSWAGALGFLALGIRRGGDRSVRAGE